MPGLHDSVKKKASYLSDPAQTLKIFGDKSRARMLAEKCNMPVVNRLQGPIILEQTKTFFKSLGKGG